MLDNLSVSPTAAAKRGKSHRRRGRHSSAPTRRLSPINLMIGAHRSALPRPRQWRPFSHPSLKAEDLPRMDNGDELPVLVGDDSFHRQRQPNMAPLPPLIFPEHIEWDSRLQDRRVSRQPSPSPHNLLMRICAWCLPALQAAAARRLCPGMERTAPASWIVGDDESGGSAPVYSYLLQFEKEVLSGELEASTILRSLVVVLWFSPLLTPRWSREPIAAHKVGSSCVSRPKRSTEC